MKRWFIDSCDFASDSAAVVLNEAAVKAIGWIDPLHQRFQGNNHSDIPVIGVIPDFNFESFKSRYRDLYSATSG